MKGKLHSENNYVARSLQMDGGCAPSNAHQKVTSPHDLSCLPIMRRSSISKQTGWHILETVSFFPSHSCLCPMGSWTKWLWSWWQRWGLCMNLTTWTTIPQGWPGYGCYWVPYLPTVETNIKPRYFTIPQGDLLTTLWPVYYIGPLFPVKSNALSLLEYSGYGFAFLAHKASAKATICGLIEYHYHGTPHNMLLTSNSLYSQRNMTVSSRSWKPLVLPCSPSSWSSWPDRKMEWSFQEKVTVTLRWQQTGVMDSP